MRVDIEIEVDMLYTGQTLNPTVTDITEKVFIMRLLCYIKHITLSFESGIVVLLMGSKINAAQIFFQNYCDFYLPHTT